MDKIILSSLVILLFVINSSLHAQSSADKFKRSAIHKMDEGQYGEAIDLLNKFISANPRLSEGYYLRGLCLEARGQYEYAVYDLRSASKLNHADKNISNVLSRVTNVWYTQLYNKIEGHKREISINAAKPINYLEIGKCYKNLGNWSEAEEWYDKYLLLEEPSSDEVIRYTEILAKTGHLTKGEVILKKFVEKYPTDHRLWSRYGYFTLWLGKNKTSIEAFSEALKYRPYFKEALDGLSLAQGKSSVYTVNDTSYRYNKYKFVQQKSKFKEYTIDKYFRLLRKQSDNDSIRILLIDELIKVNRFEEAKQQFGLINRNTIDQFTLESINDDIRESLVNYLNDKIKDTKFKVSLYPGSKKHVLELADYYVLKNQIDSAEQVYMQYLNVYPSDEEVRFTLAKRLSWFKQFDRATEHADALLRQNPKNINYKLLMAQLSIWSNKDLDYAKTLLEGVLRSNPKSVPALTSLAMLSLEVNNFDNAEDFIKQIEILEPGNSEIKNLKYQLMVETKLFEESQLDSILNEARIAQSEKKCLNAVKLYKEYFSKTSVGDDLKLELANAYVCANDYLNAIDIYSSVISKNYDYDLAKQRAKFYFWSGDSVNALREFRSLHSLNKDDAEVKLFLGDTYFKLKDFSNAKKIYSEMLAASPGSLMLQNRMIWLPEEYTGDGSLSSFIRTFPSYILLTPEVYHFNDNLSFKYNFQGLRAELGATRFFNIGGSIFRGDLSSDSAKQNFYTLTGNITVIPTKVFSAFISYGRTTYLDNLTHEVYELRLRSEVKNRYHVEGRYKSMDASQNLYSPFLIESDLRTNEYAAEGSYLSPSNMFLFGQFIYRKISDNNQGRQLTLKLGRKFNGSFIAGYEYQKLKYDTESTLYYSPENYEVHSIWADYKLIDDSFMDFNIGGKVGLMPSTDFIVKELNGLLSIKIFESLTLQGQAIFSETARDAVNYRSTGLSLMAFWVF